MSPKLRYKQTAAHKRKISEAQQGKKNSNYKHGHRIEYRLKVKGVKENDGKVVHHKDGNRDNNAKSNLQVLSDGKKKKGRPTTPKHEKMTKRK